ncbi:MAG: hypothetical protein EBX40_01545 [Gammaproteobacteria bacterium]|nr:hypothetical protein [Gammaproteobacteria bacterium]
MILFINIHINTKKKSLDLVILEVGLGGRLDAVNVVDADIGVITSIGLDHQAWLGETRAKIALEKSGIFRSHRPAVCGDADPPKEFLESLSERNIPLDLISRDFAYDEKESAWDWIGPGAAMRGLKKPSILLQNAASALMVVHRLQSRLPVPIDPIQKGLETVFLPGRYQVVREKGEHVFDVAHNPQAALVLLERLQKDQKQGQKTIAVFSMLSDKDIAGVIRIMKGVVNSWHIATLETPRAASTEQLKKAFEASGVSPVNQHADIKKAYQSALNEMRQNDRLVVFGSFYTVAAILKPMV